eukprot:TRINITY_DN113966_c0_g1_i1.p2 TRINITY_DN113966_c0_g1~~TRINITY_DN113966_c0_g1_i1.p2  ORF type:complete len:168 (-),score=12.49 TRINITY_DN113966_c0_g1_i1:270-773(-)
MQMKDWINCKPYRKKGTACWQLLLQIWKQLQKLKSRTQKNWSGFLLSTDPRNSIIKLAQLAEEEEDANFEVEHKKCMARVGSLEILVNTLAEGKPLGRKHVALEPYILAKNIVSNVEYILQKTLTEVRVYLEKVNPYKKRKYTCKRRLEETSRHIQKRPHQMNLLQK